MLSPPRAAPVNSGAFELMCRSVGKSAIVGELSGGGYVRTRSTIIVHCSLPTSVLKDLCVVTDAGNTAVYVTLTVDDEDSLRES